MCFKCRPFNLNWGGGVCFFFLSANFMAFVFAVTENYESTSGPEKNLRRRNKLMLRNNFRLLGEANKFILTPKKP